MNKPPLPKGNSFFLRRSITIGNGWNAKGLNKAKQGLWEDASACWENALEIRLQVLGEDHIDVANTYNNLGIAYGRLSQPVEALALLQKALDSRTAHYGTAQHPQVAATLHNMANVMQQSGDLDGAIEHFIRARDIHKHVCGAEHVQVARGSLALGHAYFQGDEYEKAHRAFCEALSIFELLTAQDGNSEDYATEIGSTRLDVQELEELMYRS